MGRATVRTVLQRPVCDGAQGRHGDRAARHAVGPPCDRARQAAAKRFGGAVIAAGTALPHLWQVLRDYGLPALLAPAMSISELEAVPKCITLSDLLLFWLLCRAAACLCMAG